MDNPVSSAAPGRSCGSCMMCCKNTRIEELSKRAGVWCKHVSKGMGCSIYDTRPQACRTFLCHWIANASVSDEWKPDEAKFIVVRNIGNGNVELLVDPGFPSAWRRAPYEATIREWARRCVLSKTHVLARIGERTVVILPDSEIDLGHTSDDAPTGHSSPLST